MQAPQQDVTGAPASSLAMKEQGAEGPVPRAAADLAPAGPAAEPHTAAGPTSAPAQASGKAAEESKVAHSGLDVVVADHDIIRQLFDRYREAVGPQAKLAASRTLVRHITRHASAEERTVYPLLTKAAGAAKDKDKDKEKGKQAAKEAAAKEGPAAATAAAAREGGGGEGAGAGAGEAGASSGGLQGAAVSASQSGLGEVGSGGLSPSLARMLYDRMVMDDTVNKQMLEFLDSHTPSTEQEWKVFDEAVEQFRGIEFAHLAREEEQCIGPLRSALTPQQDAKLAKQWAAAVANAPTHPHPRGPTAAAAAKLIHPVVGLVDRITDALQGVPGPAPAAAETKHVGTPA